MPTISRADLMASANTVHGLSSPFFMVPRQKHSPCLLSYSSTQRRVFGR